ncbi:TetR/AcrR family transcriptional regulator [uncultured Roseobacter sp.]|uniref:TetR/AcrR family transcriptional regulator n=1 Tax=uncultured Roseobacter sp. TaxID=114847 RepID=UPI00261684C8|nr:TetR/AcrR family transcriptional regulator [uncultured Roseobacter sp.]
MARPRNFDEDEALQKMVQVFWRHGYDATTTRMLEEATGIGVRGIANVFGDKEDIFLRVLATYSEMARGVIGQVFDPPRLEAAQMMFQGLAQPTENEEDVTNCGCLMVNTVFELGRASPKIREAVEAYRTMWFDAFHAAAEADGVSDPRGKAEFLLGLLWGALSQIRLMGSTIAAAPMAQVAVETIDGWKG